MTKTIFSKVMWVGRATVFLVGLAVILALIFGAASMAFAKNGDPWLLGRSNVATAITKLGGAAGVNGPLLQLINNNAGTNDTALDLRVQAGEAPLRVNSATKVANLNADRVDGVDSTGFLRNGAAAGGDLTGTYPDPQIAQGAVGTGEIADGSVDTVDIEDGGVGAPDIGSNAISSSSQVQDGSLQLADLQGATTVLDSSDFGAGILVPANSCQTSVFTDSGFQVGDLVVAKLTSGTLPEGISLQALVVTKAGEVPLGLCNDTTSNIVAGGGSSFSVSAIR